MTKNKVLVACLLAIAIGALALAEDASSELLVVVRAGKAGFIDRSGKIVIEPQFADARSFSEGLAAAWASVPEWTFPLAGFIDGSGKWVIKPQFEKVGYFHEGYATAKLMDRYGTWVLVSRTGTIIPVPASDISAVSMSIGDVSEGLASFSPGAGKYGFMTTNGSLAIAPTYESVRPFHEGLANVCHDKCGYVDKNGKVVVPLVYSATSDFHDGKASACDGTKCGYVDKSGTFTQNPAVFLLPGILGQHLVEYNADGLHAFSPNGKWGYVDDKRHVVIRPQFKGAEEFSEGLAAVQIDEYGTCGYIDKTGKFIIPAIFSGCDNFSHGVASISRLDKNLGTSTGYIDKTGKLIWLELVS